MLLDVNTLEPVIDKGPEGVVNEVFEIQGAAGETCTQVVPEQKPGTFLNETHKSKNSKYNFI